MRTGILVPGGTGNVQTALLDLGWEALTDRGLPIEEITWTVPRNLLEVDPEPLVRTYVAAALQRSAGDKQVLIAKSLGTYAAPLAAERELPAVWLTPLLHVPAVAEAITRNPAPQLLIGGTADPSWLPETAAATGKQLLVIEEAGHSLRPPGPLRAFTDALGTIGTAMEEFLDSLQA
ncbi:MAG: alpha/beta hydrolase [Actinoplanes sp.]